MRSVREEMSTMEGQFPGLPHPQGLYDPTLERDACGVGFVVNIDGSKSHKVLRDSETMLIRMEHRGACGCDNDSGDGAGVLTAIPHNMYARIMKADQGIDLPEPGQYATGMMFVDKTQVEEVKAVFTQMAEDFQIKVIAWRNVPVDSTQIGRVAMTTEPAILQVNIQLQGECWGFCDHCINFIITIKT